VSILKYYSFDLASATPIVNFKIAEQRGFIIKFFFCGIYDPNGGGVGIPTRLQGARCYLVPQLNSGQIAWSGPVTDITGATFYSEKGITWPCFETVYPYVQVPAFETLQIIGRGAVASGAAYSIVFTVGIDFE